MTTGPSLTAISHRRPRRRLALGALLVAVWTLLQGIAPAAAAWDDPRAEGNPCANWQEDLRTRQRLSPDEQRIHGRPFLYDGVAKLAAPMPSPITLSPEFAGSWKAACVIFEVVFRERNGEFAVAQATPRLVTPSTRSDFIAARQQAGAEVLRQIPFSQVLAKKPAPGVPQLVAVPLWPAHPFYTRNSDLIAGPVGNDLRELGYGEAERIAADGEIAIYKVFERRDRNTQYFTLVVLRPLGESEPIVQIGERTGTGPIAEQVPEGAVGDIFERLIAPWLQKQSKSAPLSIRQMRAEVRHYARGLRIDHDRRNADASLPFVVDPKTSQPLAHPLLVVQHFGQRQPGVDALRWGHNIPQPRYANIGELKQLLATAHAAREDRAHNAAAERERQKAVLAERRAQRLKTQATRSPHYVYKSDRFWASLPRFYIPQQVFNGNFGAFQINTQFPRHFRWFLEAYSARCEKHIPKPRMHRTITTQTVLTDQWGRVTSRGQPQTRDIYIEERFWPKYEEYAKVLGGAELKDFASILFSGGIELAPQRMMEVGQDRVDEVFALAASWKQFFGDGENLCTSATVAQMRENMLRAANGQPSLQAAGVRVPKAAAETEPLVPPPGKETLFDACYENHDYKDADFCMCMDARGRRVMRPEELKKYAADFSLYYGEIVFPDKGGPEDPRWRLHELLNQCKR